MLPIAIDVVRMASPSGPRPNTTSTKAGSISDTGRPAITTTANKTNMRLMPVWRTI